MANDGTVKIRIDGDDSGLQETLQSTEKSAKAAAAALASEYRKAGMSQSDAMKKAWADIKKAQADGTKIAIQGVETIVKENEKVITQKDELGKVYDKLGDSAEKAAQSVRRIPLISSFKDKMSSISDKMQPITVRTKAGLADIKAGIDLTTAALGKLAAVTRSGIDYNAQIEQLQTSFEVMTGSAEKAAEVVDRLKVMGAETPFEMTDLAGTTQLLMQYGLTADDAISKMSMLGDIAQGDAMKMQRIATAYGQMSSAGKVALEDVKQMTENGFNPLMVISEATGESMGSLYERISKGKLSVDELTQAMVTATSEGGRFYQSMEKQSRTLSGQLSTVKDNASQLLGSLTSGMSDELASEMLPMVNNMLGELQSAFDEGGHDALMTAAEGMLPDLLGMMTGKLEDAIGGLSRWAPRMVSGLMDAVPGALRSAGTAIPQITSALFEISSTIVSDLIGMMPELLPALGEGLLNMANSALIGVHGMLTGVWAGVEQWIHQGQKKIAGMWIDEARLAKYDFQMDIGMDLNADAAKSEIATAYGSIRDALEAGPLTEEQKAEILAMLGEDAGAIKAKLMEFGMEDTEAAALAERISAGGQTVMNALNELDVGVDAGTILKWFVQAGTSNVALIKAAKAAGLSDADVNEILGVFNTANGRLSSETPSFAETIYKTLTDGLADDEQTVSGLREQVGSWAEGALAEAEAGYNAAVEALDPKDPEYSKKLSQYKAEYETTKAEVESIKEDSLTIIDNLAGQSTATVEAAYQDLAAIETRTNALEKRLDELTGKSLAQAEQAYKVVTAGGKADEATISMAMTLKFNEFKVDEQAANEAYDTAISELNAQLANREITTEEYDTGVENAAAARDAAVAAAKAQFESAFGAILRGIAESEGNAAAFTDEAAMKAAAIQQLSALADEITSVTWADLPAEKKQAVASAMSTILGESVSVEDLEGGAPGAMIGQALAAGIEEIDTSLMSGKVEEVYSKALDGAMLEGTSFDTTSKSESVTALLASVFTGAAPGVTEAAKSAVSGVPDAMDASSGAKAAGDDTAAGFVNTLGSSEWKARARAAAARLGRAAAAGLRAEMQIQSPSRVMKRLGGYTGEGYTLGLQESMAQAVRVAKALSGEIVTAADLRGVMQVNMPNIQQEIVSANAQTTTPVNLDGKQIAEIQGGNNTARLAWLRARNAKGYGYR